MLRSYRAGTRSLPNQTAGAWVSLTVLTQPPVMMAIPTSAAKIIFFIMVTIQSKMPSASSTIAFRRLDKRAKKCELGPVSANKLEQLRTALRAYGSCLVAYSGGVDSVFLARVAHEVLGPRALAVIADSPSLPRRELQEALEIAGKFQFPVRVVQTAEFDNPDYLANPANRCYFCKHEL